MFSEKIHRNIFLFGLMALAFGMMVGSSPTSVAQVLLFTNWLLEADFKRKWQQLKANKLFWVLISIYLVHLIGLFYTQNMFDGINDVRTKIPLLLTPLVFFTAKPLSKKQYQSVLISFLIGCFINVTWCLIYSFLIHHNELIRDGSRFMSHIRLGLFINLAIATCFYLLTQQKLMWQKIILVLLDIYFVYVLYKLGLATGLINFFILGFIALMFLIYKQKLIVKLISVSFLCLCFVFIGNYFLKIKDAQLQVNMQLNNFRLNKTLSGNKYIHFEKEGQKENGNYVLINIQLEELRDEWKKQCPSDSFNYWPHQHNIKRYEVLVRYLASKGLNKDSAGVSQLSSEDKKNIQHNITNYQFTKWSYLHKRVYELVNEYDEFKESRNVNGHSLTMRLYYWKAATQLIKNNLLFGVGTGDVQNALNEEYISSDSPLTKDWYRRPHNQFLTMWVSLGIVGFLIFLTTLLYPIISLKKNLPVLFWPFFILTILSFLTEDTLETQAGISFYAIFNTLFISVGYFKKQQILED